MGKGKSVGIVSIKGGVGKTTTVLNLAYVLANHFGKKVAVVDANFSAPNVALHLGIPEVKNDVNDVLNGKAKLNEAMLDHELGFHVLLGANNGSCDHLKLKQKVQQLKSNYDVVLLDSSPGVDNELLATMLASDELYAVSTPDLPTLSTTLRAVKVAKDSRVAFSGLVLNKVKGKKYELKPHDMERLSGVPLAGVIRDNVKVLEALSKVKPVSALSPDSNVAVSYKKLAAKIIGENYEEPKMHTKVMSYLKDDFSNLVTHKWSKGIKYYK